MLYCLAELFATSDLSDNRLGLYL